MRHSVVEHTIYNIERITHARNVLALRQRCSCIAHHGSKRKRQRHGQMSVNGVDTRFRAVCVPFRFEADDRLQFQIASSQDGSNWQTFMEGCYRRED
jgi:hypothetical protein